MHGIIHTEIKKYVVGKYGVDAWEAILDEVGLKGKIYMTIGTYPDAETIALVTAASKLTNLPAEAILEDFGQFVTPALMKMYGSLVKPEWKTAEMLLHTEETIHKVVRMKNPGAAPRNSSSARPVKTSLNFTTTHRDRCRPWPGESSKAWLSITARPFKLKKALCRTAR